MTTLLLGSFSFLDIQNDGELKAIIHRIDKVVSCDDENEAERLGEACLCDFDSYLVPTSYSGSIDLSQLESVG
tara:strand:- start:8477 stop:8695 length:219 start_codon:yes stop_codon:yes gene_type:complete